MRPPEFERAFFIARDLGCEVLRTEVVNDREHHYIRGVVDGFEHRGWYTPPSETDSGLTVAVKPGWGEIVDDGIGWELHRRLAKTLPSVALFSHETDGMGSYATHMGIRRLMSHGLDEMSEQGLELLRRVSDDRRLVVAGISMGTVILNRIMDRNIEAGMPVNIEGALYLAPAAVDPRHVFRDMGLRFFPGLSLDIGRELITTDRRYIGQLCLSLVRSRPSLANLLPLGKQGIDLLRGTPDEEVEMVLDNYPIDVIVGENDSVGQAGRWLTRAEDHPNLRVHVLRGRGHGIAIKPYEQARKMGAIIYDQYL